jgi:hypothetical protein
MDPHDSGCVGIRNGQEHPRLVVDPAPTIPVNLPDCLEADDGAVRLNVRTFHIDYAAERCVGDGRHEDVLGRRGRSRDSHGQENQPGESGQTIASASEPSSDALSRQITQIASAWQEIWAQSGPGFALTSAPTINLLGIIRCVRSISPPGVVSLRGAASQLQRSCRPLPGLAAGYQRHQALQIRAHDVRDTLFGGKCYFLKRWLCGAVHCGADLVSV